MIISNKKITEDELQHYLADSEYVMLSGSGYGFLDLALKTNLKISDLYTKEKFDSCKYFYTDYYSDEKLNLLLAIGNYDDMNFTEDDIFFTEEYPLDNLFNNSGDTSLFYLIETPDEFSEYTWDKKIALNLNLQEEKNKCKEFLLRNLKEYFTTTADDEFGTIIKYKIRLEELCENEFHGDFLEEQGYMDWNDFWKNVEIVRLNSRNLPSKSITKGVGFSNDELEEFVDLCSKLDIKVILRCEDERDLN